MLQYPAILQPDDNGTVRVSFPDVPEAHTFGDDESEALGHAVDALETALMIYVEDRRPIPEPSRSRRGQRTVTVSVLSEAKLALYRAMIASRTSKAALARRPGVHPPQVDRLLDLSHASRIEQIEAALLATGKRLTIGIEDAA